MLMLMRTSVGLLMRQRALLHYSSLKGGLGVQLLLLSSRLLLAQQLTMYLLQRLLMMRWSLDRHNPLLL